MFGETQPEFRSLQSPPGAEPLRESEAACRFVEWRIVSVPKLNSTSGIALLLAGASLASATTLSMSFSQQHFSDGQKVSTGTFLTAHQSDPAGVNDVAPFDGHFVGSDISGPNFNASWTFNYSAIGTSITSADLKFGIYDADSAASGDQLASFSLNGVSLFPELDPLLEAAPGANVNNGQNSIVNVYDVSLPASTFTSLLNGSAAFDLTLQGPGLGVLGQTPFNGAALDFATLTVNSAGVIPEPSYLPLLAAGMLLWLLAMLLRRTLA